MDYAPTALGRVRLIVADEQPLFGEVLSEALNLLPGIEVVGRTASGKRLLELVQAHRPDVVLLDLRLPGIDTLQATRTIKRDSPDTKVVILTMLQGSEYLLESLRAGVAGYVLKSESTNELNTALRTVAQGENYFSPSLSQHALQALRSSLSRPLQHGKDLLSERERDILHWLARGMSTKEIAMRRGISRKTVRNHISNIYQKVGVTNRAGLVLYAISTGRATATNPPHPSGN